MEPENTVFGSSTLKVVRSTIGNLPQRVDTSRKQSFPIPVRY
ncbi:hypothetical protein [Leptospirillum ferriphilum]|nr:hypothetical protein [Leptospirillum ferriphilum]